MLMIQTDWLDAAIAVWNQFDALLHDKTLGLKVLFVLYAMTHG